MSSTSRTMVVRTEAGDHLLFVFDGEGVRPAGLAQGARVRVTSMPDAEGYRRASRVTIVSGGDPSAAELSEPVPTELRRLESQIERQVKRFRAGFRAGVGLDPEIVTAGLHARLGPFFHPNVTFRPNAEFGFGEVTTLVALNLEAVYRLPVTSPEGRWSAYVGMGPGFNFIDRNFEEARQGDRNIDFDDFDFDPSLNILTGIDFRSGFFMELKASAYGRPHLRLLFGYHF